MIGVLVPMVVAMALASNAVVSQLTSRRAAVTIRQSSLALDSLLRTRIDVYAEYVPSQAIVTARFYGVTPAALDALLGVDMQTELVDARKTLNGLTAFGPTGPFHQEFVQLVHLRRSIDRSTATAAEVTALFNRLDASVEATWRHTYDHVVSAGGSSDAPTTRLRLTALGLSFDAFTSGVGEENLPRGGSLESLLTATATPSQVETLIASHQQFLDATRTFPGSLGPRGAVAWKSLNDNSLNRQFNQDVLTTIDIGLNHLAPPVATDSAGVGGIARSEVAWANSLAYLVLTSSSDLRTATAAQAGSSTRALTLTSILLILGILMAVGAVLLLGGQVRRPLDRIVDAATSVREGELDFPPLDETGPRELALAAAAINEMASTLRTVQSQAIALSTGDLDDPVLRRQLPGRTGAALQTALDQLHQSVQSSESEREALFEQATRDSLTGLLNRGAALESLELALATARRSQGELLLSLFYIDLDDLKSINDSIGHDGGDTAIRAVADALRVTTRASDVIARFGGDEFVVGWLGSRGSHVPELLATRIGAQVHRTQLGDRHHRITLACSIGVAVSEPSDTTVLTLIERADHALYEAKAHGKGQARWFRHSGLPRPMGGIVPRGDDAASRAAGQNA